MFLISLLRFYPGSGRALFAVSFVLMILLGHRLVSRFLCQPGRSAGDSIIPVGIVLVLLLLLMACTLGWIKAPGWVGPLLIQTGRVYPLGAILEGLLIGLSLPLLRLGFQCLRGGGGR